MTRPGHVLLNALFLAPGVSGGTETYLLGLAPALAREFPEMRISIATTRSGAASLRAAGWERFATIIAFPCEDGQRGRRQFAEQVLLPLHALRVHAEIVHSLAGIAPVFPAARAVVTVHDLTFLRTQTFGRVTTWGMATLIRAAARHADALIAVSAAARDEVCSRLGVPGSRFAVVHHGYEPTRAATATPASEIRARYRLEGRRVVLCVAAKRPHKNQELLVRCAQELGPETAIVLAGHAEPYEDELRALARVLAVEDRVFFVGYVSDGDLEGLWSVADCAAFPTLGEGFGLPVLESLARGVPVAASNLAVLHEVADEIPHWFDPRDPVDAARAILEAMADTATAQRGPMHAAQFTWSSAARATHAVYERALG